MHEKLTLDDLDRLEALSRAIPIGAAVTAANAGETIAEVMRVAGCAAIVVLPHELEDLIERARRDMMMTKGAREVMQERARQIAGERFSEHRDDGYTNGELAQAAAAYAIGNPPGVENDNGTRRKYWREKAASIWPVAWSPRWLKLTNHRRDCIKAAALLIAELDRDERRMKKGL